MLAFAFYSVSRNRFPFRITNRTSLPVAVKVKKTPAAAKISGNSLLNLLLCPPLPAGHQRSTGALPVKQGPRGNHY
jgi:hypothetical protein